MSLPAGTLLGHYEIVGPIGSGGMGAVYKALDTRLDRAVAVKLMHNSSPALRERFYREARAIATLQHPHICALFDIGAHEGSDYLVMEYLEGETLGSPLPIAKVLEYSLQILGALEAAHHRGIAHRDLKPSNILVTSSGTKLLDFGLAKTLGTTETRQETLTAPLTEAGMIVGTAAYMSPEQAEGKAVDERSDVFSFGAVLYEMLTGQRAFQRDTQIATITAVLRDPPVPMPPAVPGALRAVVERCLQKDPERRFPSAGEVGAAMRQIDPRQTAAESPSIAILPFTNLSADRDNEYFSDGLAEEIINAITHLGGIRVAARTSAFAFRGKEVSVRRIGEELGVSTVLEGSVRRAGNRVRVTVQLVKVADGYQMWSERYDREMTDVFAIQDEISAAIVEKLKVQLGESGAAPARKRPTENVEAYNCYLQGRYYLHRYNPDSLPKSLERFRRALELDPEYALAYGGIADYHYIATLISGTAPLESVQAARMAALKAVELDDSLADTHGILCAIEAMHYNWPQAEDCARRALELDPTSMMGRYYHAAWFLRPRGRFEEAQRELQRLVEQDPLSPRFGFVHALTLYNLGRYEEAHQEIRRVIDFDQSYVLAHWVHAWVLMALDRPEEALAAAQASVARGPRASMALGTLACVKARMGLREEALAIIEQMLGESGPEMYWSRSTLCFIYVELGEVDRAIEEFLAGVENREPNTLQLIWDRVIDPVRKHHRFGEVLAAMNLPAV
ncbi:MAG: tetratricopeptide repeat protein [Acidimicrobiia bacterium]|nr:tetratricopeptide repeat protein [Acidimicrobiia bacterium]